MKFTKIHIENWRNFTRVDVPLQQRVFLVGANAFRSLSARRYSDIVVAVTIEDDNDITWRYRLVITQDNQRRPVIAPDEVLLLIPTNEGTKVEVGVENAEIRHLLESGLTVADAAIPQTRPSHADQLAIL